MPLRHQLQTVFFSILSRRFVYQLSPPADENLCLSSPYSCHEVIAVISQWAAMGNLAICEGEDYN